ncbi:MAG: hypothetical protein WA634_08455 [Silvibacterium sp.]
MKRFWMMAALAAMLWLPAMSHAQGCSLCRDSTAGSSAKTREGLRRGILVLGIPAGAVFVGILVLAWKIKPRPEE